MDCFSFSPSFLEVKCTQLFIVSAEKRWENKGSQEKTFLQVSCKLLEIFFSCALEAAGRKIE